MKAPRWILYLPTIVFAYAIVSGDFHPVVLLEGALVSLLTLPLVWRLFDLSRLVDVRHTATGVLRILRAFVVLFIPQAFVSSLDMARRILSPVIPMAPGIVAIPLRLENPIDALFFQNHMTLTPGAMVIEYDEERGVLYLHTIDATDPEKVVRDVQDTYRRARRRSP